MRMRSASCSSTSKAMTTDCSSNSSSATTCSPGKKITTNTTRVPKFLRCLYDILHTEDQSILAWSKDGSHFQILSTSRLEVEILPKYFKHGKFASFQRQLNNFGFRKWTKTQSNVCTFSHHHYVRRQPQQLVELVALQSESSGIAESAPLAVSDKLPSLNGKRKRGESTCEATKLTAAHNATKRGAHTSSHRRTGLSLIKVEPSAAFDFGGFEPWSPSADVRPLEWASKSRLTAIKSESGNETPTSAAGFADMAFDFTLEELDDILLTSSHGTDDYLQTIAAQKLTDWYGVEPPLAWADGPDLFGKAELEMYMQDTELWANH